MQHGSIILSGDQTALTQLDPSAADHPQPATLEELIGPLDFNTVADAVARAMQDEFGGRWMASGYTPEERALADELVETKYATDPWTWRR